MIRIATLVPKGINFGTSVVQIISLLLCAERKAEI
jgi:hypothetical protein